MSQVDEIRAASDIVKIVGDYVKLRKAGANYMGLCPFHQEKTPSFAVHPASRFSIASAAALAVTSSSL